MKNLQRNHALTFRVSAEEREQIRKNLKKTGMINMRTYLLKMATKGQIIRIELGDVIEMNRLLSNATNNINQIARRVNQTDRIHAAEIVEIKARQNEIGEQQRVILNRLNKVLDVCGYNIK